MKLLLKNILFTLIVPGTVGVYFPLLLTRGLPPKPGLALFAVLLLFAIASSSYLWAASIFATQGRGTPLPIDAPKKLIIQGPYRYTRNSIYLALFTALLGWTLLFQTVELVLYTLAVVAIVYFFVTRYEEPHLLREFGQNYDDYRTKVPRWISRYP